MDPATPSSRRLVLVTGPGRSGTSSVTGALEILGLVIPEPVKPADERNERGYFEPQWVVDFHEKYVNALPVRTLDSRPYAAEVALEHAREVDVVEELRTWLASKVGPERMLVKDPRLLWVHPLWLEVADGLGLDTVMLAMLRHPAEVVGSRDSAYLTAKEQRFRDQRAVAHVAGWTNVVLETERASRGRRRSFVRYDDLLQDWRTTLARTDAQLALGLGVADLGAGHHPVDDFIDPALHKSRLTWDDVDVPPVLRDLAEETWQAADQLVERPDDEALHATFDGLRARYAALHQLAEAVAMDVTTAAVTTERAARQRRVGKLKQRVARLEQQLEQRPDGDGSPRLGDAVQAVRRRLGRGRS